MLFNSYIFLLFFLPVCISGYFWLSRLHKYRLAQLFLLGMSLWFYGYFNFSYLLLIIISVLFNYVSYVLIRKGLRKIFIISILVNLGLLFYYKYMDFFIMNVNLLFRKNYSMLNIVLPLGISFFTFQQISFIVDTYHGEVDEYDLLYYASFVTFFPQLIAGPIVTHSELIPQFLDKKRKQINWDNIAKGIYIFTLGLAKKVLLADIFGAAVNWGEQNINSLDTTNAMLVMLGYTFQIYFDFSGYCDMAIGIGKMFNIDLPLNFNSPYKALTINEFWKRWHITLTKFLTKYIYIPLGGNRKGKCCTYFNIIIVFLVSGLWHGASWCFVFWGACHGIFCAITRALKKYFQGIHPALNWIMTFGFINVTWVFFRADSIVNALRLLNRILLLDFGSINENLLSCFKLAEVDLLLTKLSIEPSYHYFALLGFYVIAFIIILGCRNSYEKMVNFHPTAIRAIIIGALMAWCVCIFSNISIFIYYNF